MELLKRAVDKYRQLPHTCVPADFVSDAVGGPTTCVNKKPCYGLPKSVSVMPAIVWLHSCSVMWTAAEWEVFERAWKTQFPTLPWRMAIHSAGIGWFRIKNARKFTPYVTMSNGDEHHVAVFMLNRFKNDKNWGLHFISTCQATQHVTRPEQGSEGGSH